MKRFSATVRKLSLVAAAALVGVSGAVAQSYYDDDIYYDASKATKKEPKKQRQQPQQQALYYYDGADYVPWTQAGNYPAASEYQVTGTSTRDVDEYNRRGSYAPSAQPDSISLAEFEQMSAMSNTERLARFHDSQAAQQASPNISYDDLGNQYYTDGTGYTGGNGGTTTIVTVPTSSVSFNFGVGYPYYYNSWYGGWPYYSYYSWPYSSWYWNDWYGPGWGYGPSWSWSWGPGWGAPYPPHHHWGWGGGRYYNDPPGAIRPNRPGNGNRYYGSTGNRGSIYNSNGRRPTGSAAGATSRPATSTRPGYSAPVTRPATGSTPAGTYSGGRGRASSTYQYGGSSTSGKHQSTPSFNTNSGSSRPSSTPSYSGSRGSYSGSRGGYSGGSHGGGGGSRSGGGGYSGSRGRR